MPSRAAPSAAPASAPEARSIVKPVTSAIIWIGYRFADRLTGLIGPTARQVIVRLTAFLLMCIGVQILVTAIGDLAGKWRVA